MKDDEGDDDLASRYARARMSEAAGALLRALDRDHAGDPDAWSLAPEHWASVMTREQRQALLVAAIDACEIDDAVSVMEDELQRLSAGPPPPFTSVRAEARAWAFFAPINVMKIYLVACFRALPRAERVSALPALQRFALK